MNSLSDRAIFGYCAQILDSGIPAPNADVRPVLPMFGCQVFPTPDCQPAFRSAIRLAAPEGFVAIDEGSFLETLMLTCVSVFSTTGRWRAAQPRHMRIRCLYRLRRRC